jgi:hypothetical protein
MSVTKEERISNIETQSRSLSNSERTSFKHKKPPNGKPELTVSVNVEGRLKKTYRGLKHSPKMSLRRSQISLF